MTSCVAPNDQLWSDESTIEVISKYLILHRNDPTPQFVEADE